MRRVEFVWIHRGHITFELAGMCNKILLFLLMLIHISTSNVFPVSLTEGLEAR